MSSSEIQACEDREADGPFVPMDENRWEEMIRNMDRAKNPDERWDMDQQKFVPNTAGL